MGNIDPHVYALKVGDENYISLHEMPKIRHPCPNYEYSPEF